ncbi:hypothetical protein [Desulfoscipio gibsoniae]|uniref:Uncharacterized protein n=1 Tax=Desulfoscipio gibsoniae DSM 7213 TaxID=767817 RepID=R4KH08_9FIRM|nr:hypothetical protein [Desulfoscipio gibsoniae]AGL01894.1 hypothetical protein Desgi_2486 [Desulfoscipio gibsoniae DSM 7213]
MDKVPLITLLFYSLPESFLIFSFGLVIYKKVIKPAPIVLATVCSVLSSYIARLLPLPYGVHTIIGFLVVFILFYTVLGLSIKQSLLSALLSLGTLVALENTILNFIQYYLHFSVKDVIALSPLDKTLIGWPHLFVWAVLTFFIKKKYLTNQTTVC